MATFGKDGYLYVKNPHPRREFLVKWKDKWTGYVMQHIHSIDTHSDLVGKKVRIKVEVIE